MSVAWAEVNRRYPGVLLQRTPFDRACAIAATLKHSGGWVPVDVVPSTSWPKSSSSLWLDFVRHAVSILCGTAVLDSMALEDDDEDDDEASLRVVPGMDDAYHLRVPGVYAEVESILAGCSRNEAMLAPVVLAGVYAWAASVAAQARGGPVGVALVETGGNGFSVGTRLHAAQLAMLAGAPHLRHLRVVGGGDEATGDARVWHYKAMIPRISTTSAAAPPLSDEDGFVDVQVFDGYDIDEEVREACLGLVEHPLEDDALVVIISQKPVHTSRGFCSS